MAKKRANGEGNIRKRADGRWEGRYTAGYNAETGKRIIKNVLGKTQAECKAKLAAAMEATKGIDVSRADEYTVATWLRSWYDIYAKPNVRVATADRYRLMIEQYAIPRIGSINLLKLTYDNLRTQNTEAVTGAQQPEERSPLDLFREFYQMQNNQPLSEEQEAFLKTMLEEIWEEMP